MIPAVSTIHERCISSHPTDAHTSATWRQPCSFTTCTTTSMDRWHSSSTSCMGTLLPEPRIASCAKRRSASLALFACIVVNDPR